MIPWGGIFSCLGGAAFYASGKFCESEANALSSTTRIHQLKDLPQMFDSRSNDSPLVVTVFGRVGSDTPIVYEHSGLQGVISWETAEQNFMVKKSESGEWENESIWMPTQYKEVPWYLDDGTGRVHVVGARNANGFVLQVAKKTFEESGGSNIKGSYDDFHRIRNYFAQKKIKDFKMLGVTRVESVFPTGQPQTVVGEAVKDEKGQICIQRPEKGPFYVSSKGVDQIISDLRRDGRFCKYTSLGLTLLGISLIAGEYA
ncbi:RING-type E3 ubiquitin transferase [Ranunculus cassubicifolius]